MSFAKVYPLYVDKAVKKGRTQDEVDEIIEKILRSESHASDHKHMMQDGS